MGGIWCINISAISSRSLLLVEETGLSVISIKYYISGSTQTQFFFYSETVSINQ
jgi:hypothetical protein